MEEKIEARIALCKCKEGRRTYGVRFQKTKSGWKYTWAFPVKEESAKREGYDKTQIIGNIEPDDDYPGCPYCGARYFIVCGCGKLSCNNIGNLMFTCDWCGTSGLITGNYDGSGIESGGDA